MEFRVVFGRNSIEYLSYNTIQKGSFQKILYVPNLYLHICLYTDIND